MLQKQFTPEQEAVIADWVSKFSKGKSIDFRRVQADDSERWRHMSQSHGQGSIRAKIYYHRRTVTKDIPPKPSMSKGYVPPKIYKCRKCDYKTDTKQSLGVHYRFQHPVAKFVPMPNGVSVQGTRDPGGEFIMANVPTNLVNQFVIVSPNGEVRAVKILNFCPECGSGAIKTHLVAHNI